MQRMGLGLMLGLAACADVGSSDLRTSGMWADLSVVSEGTGSSQAIAILRAGGALSNTYVELEGDDKLTATLAGDTREMAHEYLGDIHRYVAQYDTAPVEEPFTIALLRTLDAGAPASEVVLPPEFTLDEPAVTTFSRNAEELALSWSPTAEDPMRIEISGECIAPWRRDLDADPGALSVPAGALEPWDEDEPLNCELEVRVSRLRQGTVDPAFEQGGTAYGSQVRSFKVASTP